MIQTIHAGRLALLVGSALLTATSTALAAPAGCNDVTIKHIRVSALRPQSCIAVDLPRATVLLDKALVDAHAKGLLASDPDDDRLSRAAARRARDLLQVMTPRTALDACARVDGKAYGDWQFYVTLQLDRGWAAVQPTGSNTLISTVVVRERSTGCSGQLGGIGTLMYGIPDGGPWFLALVASVS